MVVMYKYFAFKLINGMKRILILHILFFNALISSAQLVALSISNGNVIQCDTWSVIGENLIQGEVYLELKAGEKLAFSYFNEDDSAWKNDLPIVLYSESGFTTSETGSRTIINVSTSGCYNLDIVLDTSLNISNPSVSIYESAVNCISSTTSDIYDSICISSLPYQWKNQYITASGVYSYDTLNVMGNDSIITLHLTVNDCTNYVEDITNTTATLKWLPDSAVVQYDINVYTSETHFAQYIVGANGQILSSQRFVPSIYKHKLDTTTSSTEYFTISLDGLSAGTDYTYTIEGTNAESVPIYHEEGTFTTLNEDEEGLFDAVADDPRKQAQKLLRGDVLFIERNDKIYNLNGIEVQTTNQ